MTVCFCLASAIGMALKCHQGYIHFTSKLSFFKACKQTHQYKSLLTMYKNTPLFQNHQIKTSYIWVSQGGFRY